MKKVTVKEMKPSTGTDCRMSSSGTRISSARRLLAAERGVGEGEDQRRRHRRQHPQRRAQRVIGQVAGSSESSPPCGAVSGADISWAPTANRKKTLRTSGAASRSHRFGTTPRGMAEMVGEDQRMGAPEAAFGCRCARPSRSGACFEPGFTPRGGGCQRVSGLRSGKTARAPDGGPQRRDGATKRGGPGWASPRRTKPNSDRLLFAQVGPDLVVDARPPLSGKAARIPASAHRPAA